jgi:hypothetical protein
LLDDAESGIKSQIMVVWLKFALGIGPFQQAGPLADRLLAGVCNPQVGVNAAPFDNRKRETNTPQE